MSVVHHGSKSSFCFLNHNIMRCNNFCLLFSITTHLQKIPLLLHSRGPLWWLTTSMISQNSKTLHIFFFPRAIEKGFNYFFVCGHLLLSRARSSDINMFWNPRFFMGIFFFSAEGMIIYLLLIFVVFLRPHIQKDRFIFEKKDLKKAPFFEEQKIWEAIISFLGLEISF